MARRPNETVQTNLRIKEALRRKLEREAKRHGISFNKEVMLRIEGSFETGANRDLTEIAEDLKANWLRFGERFLLLDLEEQLAEALAKTTDPEVSKLAQAWLLTRHHSRDR
jgi:hypothetical protein